MQKAAMINAEFRPISEHLYEQPMVVFPSHLHNKASTPTASERSPFLMDEREVLTPIPPSLKKKYSPYSGLPQHVQCMNWASVTSNGAKVTLPNASGNTLGASGNNNVSLTIPQGAVGNGHTQDLFVALVDQEEYSQHLRLDSLSQTAVTPIVQCGFLKTAISENKQYLQKPVVLSVPHIFGSANQNKKPLIVLYCQDLDSSISEWEILTVNGQDPGKNVSMEVDSAMCHLVTDKLGAYVLVANLTDLNEIGGHVRLPGCQASSGYSSMANSPMSDGPINSFVMPKLSPSTRQAVCRSLDVPTCQGNDWRNLAQVLGVEQYSSFFSSQPSPSEALLDLWEAKTTRSPDLDQGVNLQNFANLLREISREDVVVILERELK